MQVRIARRAPGRKFEVLYQGPVDVVPREGERVCTFDYARTYEVKRVTYALPESGSDGAILAEVLVR